ncbi:MAG: DUF1614 domain-containing protein [Candidatus Bathyarchaeota archaeon]|nr:MAG: DUF1614 domain-containing protein [Candidatus Bathyarchaeota archaeon]
MLSLTLALLFLGVIGTAFKKLGLGTLGTLILLSSSLIGSYINIPITSVSANYPIIRLKYVKVFGKSYHIPTIAVGIDKVLIAINIGGAIVPLIASIFLISRKPQSLIYALPATLLVAIVLKRVSRPVKGVGIVTPSLVPPLLAAFSAIALSGEFRHIIAYVSGTLGTLIGADLLNFKKFPQLGSSIISIGGAGTFDGIFLSGIIAVLIAF